MDSIESQHSNEIIYIAPMPILRRSKSSSCTRGFMTCLYLLVFCSLHSQHNRQFHRFIAHVWNERERRNIYWLEVFWCCFIGDLTRGEHQAFAANRKLSSLSIATFHDGNRKNFFRVPCSFATLTRSINRRNAFPFRSTSLSQVHK